MKTKKLIVFILILVVIMLGAMCTNSVKAAEPNYVTIIKERTEGSVKYKHQINSKTPSTAANIWNLVTCDETGKVISDEIPDLYCLRAGLGFSQETPNLPNYPAIQYTQRFNMPSDYSSVQNALASSEVTIFKEDNKASFYKVMWILDHMLLEGASDEELNTYLKEYAEYQNNELTEEMRIKGQILTRSDIEVIQQLAIWHYTNSDDNNFSGNDLKTLYIAIGGSAEYSSFSDLFNIDSQSGTKRQEHANDLYKKLINEAEIAVTSGGGTYQPDRRITVYLAGTNAGEQQPIVRIEESNKEVDLALRKFISAVNGVADKSREPVVDTTSLNKEIKVGTQNEYQTTAKYNHTKEPLKVQIGDVITYTLRIYNEGELPAYATQVTDYLPSYLEYVAYDKDTQGAFWSLDQKTARIATTTSECKVVGVGGKLEETEIGKKLSEVLIPAAEKKENSEEYELSYVDIQISCKVMSTAPYDTNITNLAQITEMKYKNGDKVESDRDSTPNGNFNLPSDSKLPSYEGNGKDGNYVKGQEDDDDFEKVYVEAPALDLALRKFISAVGETKYDRAPEVISSGLKTGAETAIYNHSKEPVQVKIGDIVTYTIRVYNEGEVDARVTEITDYLATYLEYVPYGEDSEGKWWTYTKGEEYNEATSTADCKIVGVGGKTARTNVGKKIGEAIIPAYDGETDTLSYVDIEIHCKVLPVTEKTKVTNIAEITKEADKEGNPVDKEEDSTPDDVKKPEDFPGYKDEEKGKDYIPGQEDDDDFEKVEVIPKFDLALRKFITRVGTTNVNNRYPTVTYEEGKLKYTHSKEAVEVETGDTVIYTIRVYNEGEADGYAEEITDDMPEGLEFLPDNETNKEYRWVMLDENEEETTDVSKAKYIITDYLSEAQGKEANRDNLIKAFNKDAEINDKNPDYRDVQIAFKVIYTATNKDEMARTIVNTAQISKDSGDDEDSKPNRDEVYEKDGDNEDDIDYDQVKVKYFDLALRKFITRVGTTNVNNRYPTVTYEEGELKYTHSKEAVEVATGDTVIYTIRVYNEGEIDGYAEEITDDMPEGLEFLPDNETNKEYRWVMLDENEEETTDVSKAKYIITDYLSEAQGKEANRDNLIKAFNKDAEINDKNPDYRDVQIAFKVIYTATNKDEMARTIVNTAQISKDSGDDEDSKPNRDEVYEKDGDNEDDIDYDQVKVKYFDLSLLKWVSQTKVTLNGKTTTTNTGHTAETSKNEAPVKIEVKASDVKKIKIQYVYTIRVTNEGEIEGYAKEVTDYVPKGLKFVKEDNPDWYEISDGVIGTKALENKLLKPGESAEVKVVLTWINGSENFGEKINLAEISKDENPSGSPDVDSTPNNKDPKEDDIDDAPVILAVKTGVVQIYAGLTMIILITIAGGISLIKKYVLE